MSKCKIALSIECSHTRGMGHLYRSFYYLDYFKAHDIDYVYLINDDKPARGILEDHQIDYIVVDYFDTKSNWEKDLVSRYGVDIWVNDKFETSYDMAQHVKDSGAFFVLIDDVSSADELCDMYFAGFVAFSKKEYNARIAKHGPEYMILNPEIGLYKKAREEVNRILVSLGGADPFDTTVSVVEELMKTEYSFDVLLGSDATCLEELKSMQGDRFQIYQRVPSAIELFSHYDFAITGGGLTCCEANAAGIPCIIIANAPHEINTGLNVEKIGGSIFAGDYSNWNRDLVHEISKLNISEMSRKGMNAFSLDGVDRIFGEIMDETIKTKRIIR